MSEVKEREILFLADDYIVYRDGGLTNLNQKPLTNIIYELALRIKENEDLIDNLNLQLDYWVNGEYCDTECNLAKELENVKDENNDLRKTILQKCPQCGESYLSPKGAELYDENYELKASLKQIQDITKQYNL